jgi:hypothetical protein
VKLHCPRCDLTNRADLTRIREPDRICRDCRVPWQPASYRGRFIVEDATVMPADAWWWLSKVPDGSGHWTLAPSRVAREHAQAMREGRWKSQRLPNETNPVTFDAHGMLLIGLCRLLACVDSQQPLETVVARFSVTVDGHVPYSAWQPRKTPGLLKYWKALREAHAP